MTDDLSPRPPLDERRLRDAGHGLIVEVVDAAPSTNALVAARAREGAPEGLVVVAEHQTAGRGRLDRTWETPPRAALTFSVLLRPDLPPAEWPWLPLLAGYALARALRAHTGIDAGVKWPNDVLVGERKVAGILVERVETPTGPAAVVGVGLNVSTTPAELPIPNATSLAMETGAAPDRSEVLVAILRALLEEYAAWRAGGTAELRAAYTRECVTIGTVVHVDLPSGQPLNGRATGVDPGGRLLVSGPAGETAVGAGDVIHVRTTDR